MGCSAPRNEWSVPRDGQRRRRDSSSAMRVEQIEREGDAGRVDLEVLHQAGRQAHARERVAVEAPRLARLAASAAARLQRPRPRSAARSCGRPGRARSCVSSTSSSTTLPRSALEIVRFIKTHPCRCARGSKPGNALASVSYAARAASLSAFGSAIDSTAYRSPGFLPGNPRPFRRSLRPACEPLRDRQLRPCPRASARRRSRRAPPPTAPAAGRRRRRAPSTRKSRCGLNSISR